MWWRLLAVWLIAAVYGVPVVWPDRAVAQDAVRATEIRVEGSQRIEPDTVRSYVPIQLGDPITPLAMDEALKKLFGTGLFADVMVRQEGSVVVVRVVENPIINRIAFEGNRRITDEVLRDEVRLRPRIVYTRSRVQSDVQRIIDLYRRSGRFSAIVEPKVIQLEQNRVDLVFEIEEGPPTEIRRIGFVGNQRFSDRRLREVIRTRESAWYRFLSTDDNYDPDRLTFDRELLRRFYLSQGYADFRVLSAIAELAPDREGFFITFTIEEGERYRFGKVDIVAALEDLSVSDLERHVPISEGDWYNADRVEDVISDLTDLVGTLGYAFVDIRPQVRRDREERKIDVTFHVQEGPRVYVERINITGNVRTIDPVIRREIPLVEGDAFNTAKMRRARQRIRNLGFFERVEVDNVPGSAADRTTINVEVAEQPTGEISFGAGFSSTLGVIGDIGIRERNLLGRGQDLLLRLQLSARSSEIDLKFTEPYFLERRLRAGVDLFRVTRDLRDESSFERRTTGGGVRLGYDYSETLSHQWTFHVSQDEIENVSPGASLAVREQEGSATKVELGQVIVYDRRDDFLEPRSGHMIRYGIDIAGLGGNVRYFRNELRGTQYFPLFGEWVGNVGFGGGYMVGLGQETRITDRFFLGGHNLRGFANFGAGPRDAATGDAVGGRWYYSGGAQATFPMGLPNEFGIRGRIFTDFGSSGSPDTTIATVRDTGSLRASMGAGLSWNSPFGPIAIDIAWPLIKEDFDQEERLRFSFGTRF